MCYLFYSSNSKYSCVFRNINAHKLIQLCSLQKNRIIHMHFRMKTKHINITWTCDTEGRMVWVKVRKGTSLYSACSHCFIVLTGFFQPNVVHGGSSVNYSTLQEGRGTWLWGLGARSQTIKPGSRPPALFATTIPAQFLCFLPGLRVSCPSRGSKCCCCS